jgi:hypothetical protein
MSCKRALCRAASQASCDLYIPPHLCSRVAGRNVSLNHSECSLVLIYSIVSTHAISSRGTCRKLSSCRCRRNWSKRGGFNYQPRNRSAPNLETPFKTHSIGADSINNHTAAAAKAGCNAKLISHCWLSHGSVHRPMHKSALLAEACARLHPPSCCVAPPLTSPTSPSRQNVAKV